jgi:hypothetical protein
MNVAPLPVRGRTVVARRGQPPLGPTRALPSPPTRRGRTHTQVKAAEEVQIYDADMGIWHGVAMDSLKIHPGMPYPTLLCRAGGLRPSSTLLDTPRRASMCRCTVQMHDARA